VISMRPYNSLTALRMVLCASLSDDSKPSLAFQGAIFSPEQSDTFTVKDRAAEAIRVRI